METPGLANQVEKLLGPKHPVFAAAVIAPDRAEVAVKDAPLDADFEIASISKGLTGLLYAHALAKGEITDQTTLDELLPLRNTPVGGITLASLSIHRSGLPSLPKSMHPRRREAAWRRHGKNPYGDSLEATLEQARAAKLGRSRPKYSNFGFMLLGHALASAAGTTYAELLAERIAEPFQMAGTYVAASPHELRVDALLGKRGNKGEQEPWTGEGVAPAGGVRATAQDMGNLMHGLLHLDAPGLGALDPVARFSLGLRIGAGWLTMSRGASELTWHNGQSGGFASIIVLDRAARIGVTILTARSATIDSAGFRLLDEIAAQQ